jgi:hypothetical protein
MTTLNLVKMSITDNTVLKVPPKDARAPILPTTAPVQCATPQSAAEKFLRALGFALFLFLLAGLASRSIRAQVSELSLKVHFAGQWNQCLVEFGYWYWYW